MFVSGSTEQQMADLVPIRRMNEKKTQKRRHSGIVLPVFSHAFSPLTDCLNFESFAGLDETIAADNDDNGSLHGTEQLRMIRLMLSIRVPNGWTID